MLRPLVIAMAFGLPTLGMTSAHAEAPRQISVTGRGVASAAPDMATVMVGVVAQKPTAGEAMAAMSAALTDVLAAVVAAGVSDRDVQTSGMDLYPVYADRQPNQTTEPGIIGFTAQSTLALAVHNLPGLGGVLDRVVTSGANQMQGLTFGFQDPEALMNQARKAAVADAMAKAALYAGAAGIRLGDILSITEDVGAARPEFMAKAMMASDGAPPPIAEGEVSLTAQVNMVLMLRD